MVSEKPVEFRLLGQFALLLAPEQELTVSGLRQRALLAYLASRGSFRATREGVATLLWSEMDDRAARHNLRQTVLRLRRDLEQHRPTLLVSDSRTISLQGDAVDADIMKFSQLVSSDDPASLAAAIELYNGDFLADFPAVSETFDEWVNSERARFKLMLGRAIERYIHDPMSSPSLAVTAVNKLVSSDPFDERSQRMLLQVLAKHYGDEAALAHAELFAKQLQKELGVRPDENTQALVAEIRSRTLKARPIALERAAMQTLASSDIGPVAFLFEGVPPRDLNFVGRDGGLGALDKFLRQPTNRSAAKHVAIHGLGGIGKTSLAAEFAHRHASEYAGVWWARAPQRALLVNSLSSLAIELDPRLGDEPDHEKAAIAGLARMSRLSKPFLLIYDNVESPDTIKGLLPSIGAHVIITSRWVDWSGRAAELKLEAFAENVAIDFLQKRAGQQDPTGAAQLADSLGRLPLALDHAGAYCRMTATSFNSYLEKLDIRLERAPKGVAYPASVAATFRLAIEAATQQHASAGHLLSALAFFSPTQIPLSLVASIFSSEEDRGEALAALYAASLVEYKKLDDDELVITLHPIVQAAVRTRLAEQGETTGSVLAATKSLASLFPEAALTDPETWPSCALLLLHVLSVRQFISGRQDVSESTARLLRNAGAYLQVRGSYREAEALYRQALSISASVLEKDSSLASELQNSLALLLSTTGRYDEAEPLLRQTIIDGKSTLGADNLNYAIRLNNLGRLLSDTKRYDEAEPLYREAIEVADKHTETSQPYSVAWRNNLGIVLNETGRNQEGEAVYRQALSIAEERLGRGHHEMARCLNNLAKLLQDSGRWAEAEALVREALKIWHEMFGKHHALPARGQHNLAGILLGMKRFPEAVEVAEDALYIHENTLGISHFWTRDSARACARAYDEAGQLDKAQAVRQRFGVLPTIID